MKVIDLIARIIAAYPGATPEAMATFKPVFYARLQRHEGDALEQAATAVLAEFKPTPRQPFPICADFEKHLPTGKLNLPPEGSPLRKILEDRRERAGRLFADWHAGQGAKIKAARSFEVYAACLHMAHARANAADTKTQRVILSAEQISECDMRALSGERTHRFGRLPATNEEWQRQIDEIGAGWHNRQGEAA